MDRLDAMRYGMVRSGARSMERFEHIRRDLVADVREALVDHSAAALTDRVQSTFDLFDDVL
jgi:hypothetical protein